MNKNTTILFMVLWFFSLGAIAATIDNLAEGGQGQSGELPKTKSLVIENLNSVQQAFNTSASTDNIKICRQSKVAICKLRLRERITSLMQFNDKVQSFVLGDSANFEFEAIDTSRKLFKLRGIFPGADTNLTIIGESGLIYSFYIRIDSVKSKFLPDFVVRVIAKSVLLKRGLADKSNIGKSKQNNALKIAETKQSIDYLDTKPNVKAESLDFNFEIYNGDKALMPKNVFDDGIWTYWQYGDKDLNSITKLPVLYAVVDGHDMLVNSKIEGGYLITESISQKWTIRSGEAYACVRKFN